MHRARLKGLVLIAIVSLSATGAQAQKKEITQKKQDSFANFAVNNETYNQVLDIVFPRDILNGILGYALVLRYEPTYEPESQIMIVNRAGRKGVVEYTPVDGNIYQQLRKILWRSRKATPKQAAKQIKIRRRVLSASPAVLKEVRESFFDRLVLLTSHEKNISGENIETINIADDGTQYQLWYRGQSEVHFDLIGSNVDSASMSDESPIVVWMKEKKRMLSQLPTASQ